MLTYVINTSENKTFDSSTLFEITGYNKIRWMHCSLDEIQSQAELIFEKQNVLGAEDFRVAVIVDFYKFDRVRLPYGRHGFKEDSGVDLSIYMPYIEAYLMDNLVTYLEKKDLYSRDFEVYYVQNEKSERFDLFENASGQLEKILSGDEPSHTYTSEAQQARKAAKLAVKRITKAKTENDYPNMDEIHCRPTEKWTSLNMTWQGSKVVVSMPMSERWTVRDSEPNEHLIYCDGVHIGNIFIEENAPAIKKLTNKSYTIGNVQLNYDLRLVEDNSEYIYRYVFDFTFTENGHENRAFIEINYDQIDEKALERILRDVLVSTTDDRSFDDKFTQINDVFYKSFTLYCSEDVKLKFNLTDYPYGAEEMTFTQFWKAFCYRQSLRISLKRHYYIVPYGGGSSRAALDTLSLSLYLIRMYEREELSTDEGDMEVFHLDSEELREVLEDSWRKVNTAKVLAKSSEDVKFFALTQVESKNRGELPYEETAEEYISKQTYLIEKNYKERDNSPEDLYEKIGEITDRKLTELTDKNRRDFDEIMSKYLAKRDDTKEANAKEEFINLKSSDMLTKVDKCPSKEDYNHIIKEKQEYISKLFKRALSSEYIEVDYSEERKVADSAYKEYKNAKACLNRNLLGDLIFMILAVAAMIIPYIVFQLTSYSSPVFSSTMLGLYMTAFFVGLFILAVIFQMLPLARKISKSKALLKKCYIDALAKESYAFSAIRRKYEKDLIDIEQQRYDMRQIKHIYETNIAKEKNIAHHREMLERLEDCLSGILNNLDVEPKFTILESLDGELDLSKPVQDKSNRIYHVFSIETIEKMFPKKGRD
jgi:hypothetical protein